MRLGCPNCDAQYEVDDGAIPPGGRDVQCSNCGHGWFQAPEVADDTADLFDAPRDQGFAGAIFDPAVAATVTQSSVTAPSADLSAEQASVELVAAPPVTEAPAPAPDATPEATPVAADPPPDPAETAAPSAVPLRRTLDENLMAVLREEAARETAERRAEATRTVEVQTDMGLTEASTPHRAMTAADAAATPAAAGLVTTAERTIPRRELLPDIEEINSTLRSGREDRGAPGAAANPQPDERRRGFRFGFFGMLAVAAVLVVAYILAPQISQALPATADTMAAFVTTVDASRMWLDGALQRAAGALRGFTGDAG